MQTLVEHKHGNGAKRQRIDLRDHKYKRIAKASIPFDWSTAKDETLDIQIKDQGTSDSCGGQSGSYLQQILMKTPQLSAKSIYSLIWYKGGGTTMRDVFKTICNRGVNLETDVPSYPNTEQSLTNKGWVSATTDISAAPHKALKYAFVNTDIESAAQAIRDTGGCILEIEGVNNGSWLSPTPIPPTSKVGLWGHFTCGVKPVIWQGKKAIKFVNSWGKDTGLGGFQYLTEDYFKSGHVVAVGVLYEPTAPGMSPAQKQIAITIIQKLLNLYYQLLDRASATFSKVAGAINKI